MLIDVLRANESATETKKEDDDFTDNELAELRKKLEAHKIAFKEL